MYVSASEYQQNKKIEIMLATYVVKENNLRNVRIFQPVNYYWINE